MPGTSAGAAKRERCPRCNGFKHANPECPKRGAKKRLTEEQLRAGHTAYERAWRAANPEKRNAIHARWRANVKLRVMTHYSGGEPTCACCGITGLVFLTLDHVNGDGAQDRRAAGHKGGIKAYTALIKAGFPPGHQVLCWNCNAAKHIAGVCPHQRP